MLARYVQEEREAMELSIEEAANVTGIEVSRWCALEGGWIPEDDDPLLHSIATTLEANYFNVSLYAAVSRYNQSLPL
jgi:hypothetical protein